MDEMTNEQGITPVDQVEDDVTPAGESVPRRFAMQSIVGGFAGLAALAAASDVGAQNKKKSSKKKSSKQKAQAKKARSGQITRVRQVFDSVNISRQTNRRITLNCPRGRQNERAFVVGGGYVHTTNSPEFVVSASSPATNTSFVCEGHNHTSTTVSFGCRAVCVYYRK